MSDTKTRAWAVWVSTYIVFLPTIFLKLDLRESCIGAICKLFKRLRRLILWLLAPGMDDQGMTYIFFFFPEFLDLRFA